MKIKSVMVAVVAVVAVVAAILLVFFREVVVPGGSTRGAASSRKPLLVQNNAETSAVKFVTKDTNEKSKGKERKWRRATGRIGNSDDDGVFRDSDGNPYPEADQRVMTLAAAAMDDDDLECARSLAEEALSSGNRDLREAVVDALGWFGEDTMMELVPFLSDPDEEIAEAAQSHWMGGLQQMEDDGEKAGVIEVTLKTIKNKDMAEDVANELVGIDELAAIQVVADVLSDDANPIAMSAVKEVYESLTGEEWKSFSDAENWLAENYVAPDTD